MFLDGGLVVRGASYFGVEWLFFIHCLIEWCCFGVDMGFYSLYYFRMANNDYLTPKQIAERERVTVRAVQIWCAEGRLDAVKLGRDWFIPRSSYEAFVAPAKTQKK